MHDVATSCIDPGTMMRWEMPGVQVMAKDLPNWEQLPGDASRVFSQDSLSMSQLDSLLQDFGFDADQMLEETLHASTALQAQHDQQNTMPLPPSPFGTTPVQPSGTERKDISVAGAMDPSPYSWPSIPAPMLSALPSTSRSRLSSLLSAPDIPSVPWTSSEDIDFRLSAGDVLDVQLPEHELSGSLKRKQPYFGIGREPRHPQGAVDAPRWAEKPLEIGDVAEPIPKSFKLVMAKDAEQMPIRNPPKEPAPFSVHKWKPPAVQTQARPESPMLTQPPFRQGLSSSVEYEEPDELHAAVVCGPSGRSIKVRELFYFVISCHGHKICPEKGNFG